MTGSFYDKEGKMMDKSENYIFSKEFYEDLTEEQKKNISLDLFYNAICCFHDVPAERMADMLMAMKASDDENFKRLEKTFQEIRALIKKIHKEVCDSGCFDSYFTSPDIEDILFYQISNGLPIE